MFRYISFGRGWISFKNEKVNVILPDYCEYEIYYKIYYNEYESKWGRWIYPIWNLNLKSSKKQEVFESAFLKLPNC